MKILNNTNFDEYINSKDIVTVDFFGTWCPPCKMLTPILEELGNSRKYNIAKVDIDASNDIASKYRVDSVPTLIVFKEGKVLNRTVGYMDKESVMKFIDSSEVE
ncbi:MAG: thioredoxin [Clostridia bacterium]